MKSSHFKGPCGSKGEPTMRKAKFWKALVAAVLIAALLCGGALAATRSAKVFSSSMTVYKTKSTRSRVGVLRKGTSIKVTGIAGKWARISYKGHTGYAKLSNIAFNKRIKMVTTKSSSIRFMTKGSYRKNRYYTGTLAAGVTLYVAGINGREYLFYDESGKTVGYVKKSAVRRA